MSAASTLLDHLAGLKQTVAGRWIARCPAHDDRNPSLSVRELDDGRVLVYCFAGCDTADVVAAVGLSLSDLYPDSPPGNGKPQSKRATIPATVSRTAVG